MEKYIKNKYTPSLNLGNDISACDSTINLSVSNGFASINWSNGSTSPTTTINQNGIIYVDVTSVFNESFSDTISIINIQPPLPALVLPNNNILCSNADITWNTLLPNNLFTFTGQTTPMIHYFLIIQPGQYYVTVTDTNGCFINSDTININQDNFPSTTSLGPDTSLCAGNSISLLNGSQTGVSYLWNDNSTNTSLLINSSGQYWITATNSNNCIAKDTINVTVVGQAPIAGFQNTNTCENTNISFTDTSIAQGGATITNWFWNFGDTTATNDTSIASQPNYTYTDTGSYTINLTVTTNAGCKQNLTKNIYIYPKPIVDFINIIACQNDTAFFSEAINPLGYAITNYQWSFGDGAASASCPYKFYR
ncbi:MAG: PKD domain-containing protein [Bacteroidetes bacterium]|nr:PKD domain-containing protein [Bacteroidota bacterium]